MDDNPESAALDLEGFEEEVMALLRDVVNMHGGLEDRALKLIRRIQTPAGGTTS
jgi:hypothetical protein